MSRSRGRSGASARETVLTLSAVARRVRDDDGQDRLYRAEAPSEPPVRLSALPYHLCNNRGRGSMTVWVPEA